MSEVPADRGISLPVLDWRLKNQEEATKTLRHWRGNTDMKLVSLEGKLDQLSDDLGTLSDNVASVRKLLISLLVSVVLATLTFALSLLAATGRI